MASIDERVVSMAFENSKFEANIAKTMASLAKLNDSLKIVGATKGLDDLTKASEKINFSSAGKAADGLRSKLSFPNVGSAFSAITNAAGHVNFSGLINGLVGVDKKLAETGGEKAFSGIENSANSVNLEPLKSSIDGIGAKFSAVSVVATTALATIANKAVNAGVGLAKSLTIDPIKQGFDEYATNLNSIQTVLANTASKGSTLKDVNGALAELNTYSDQTIYNFGEMAKNIGTFTAAGVDLDTSVKGIKGIANLAALSGSNSQQASTAMYQLSQAIASGKVGLQDWNSVVNAGMGGDAFQRALTKTAQNMGTLNKSAADLSDPMKKVKIDGESFRDSISAKPGKESWLTSDVLLSTLNQFTGDLSDAELAAQGFDKASIKAIQNQAKLAKDAATQVKTIAQGIDVVKESVGSGFSATFQNIFGDFEESKKTFTAATSFVTDFVGANADARNKVLKSWKDMGGRTILLNGIKLAFEALFSVLKPISKAFREIFPRKTAQDLVGFSRSFTALMEKLKLGPEAAKNLRHTFAGLFAIISIGKTVLTEFIRMIGHLLGASGDSAGGVLKFTRGIGDFLVSVDKALKEGSGLADFFARIQHVLEVPIKLIGAFARALSGLFGGFDVGKGGEIEGCVKGVSDSLSPMAKAVKFVTDAWDGFVGILDKVWQAMKPFNEDVKRVFGDFGKSVEEAFKNQDFSGIFAIIQTTLIGGIFLAIKKALGQGVNIDVSGGFFKTFNDTFKTLNGNLKAMQQNIKADTLMKIGIALALLAAGVLAFTFVDPKKLAKGLAATAVGLGELIGALALLAKAGGKAGALTLPFIAVGLVGLAVAVGLLSVSVAILGRMSWEQIGKGLAAVIGLIVGIGGALKLMGPSIILIGPGLIPVAIALNIMAGAMAIFGSMKWDTIAKGLVGIAGGLTAIGIGTLLMGPSLIFIGPGLIGVAFSIGILADGIGKMGALDTKTIARGIRGMAIALLVLSVALRFLPKGLILQGAGLIVVAIGLKKIVEAIGLMGSYDYETLKKGIAGMAASLILLALGLFLMQGSLAGAIALGVAAFSLGLLVPVLALMGTMKLSTIAKGLGYIAASLLVIGLAGAIASPGLLLLGAGLVAVGIGVSVIGAGIYVIAKAIVLMGGDGVKAFAGLTVAIGVFIAVLPKLVISFVKGLVEIVAAIVKIAPAISEALVKIVLILLDGIIAATPKLGEAVLSLVTEFVRVLYEGVPKIIVAAYHILLAFLTGIKNNIGQIVTTVGLILERFFTALAERAPEVLAAGVTFIVTFLRGLREQLPRLIPAGAKTIALFLNGLASKAQQVIDAAVNLVISIITAIGNRAQDLITAGVTVVIKILEGIGQNAKRIARAAANLIGDFLDAAAEAMLTMTRRIARVIINFLTGLAAAIEEYEPQIIVAGTKVGIALITGMVDGLNQARHLVTDKVKDIAGSVATAPLKILGIKSPSTVFAEMGKNVMLGLHNGLNDNSHGAIRSVSDTAGSMVSTMQDTLSVVPNVLDGLMDMDPVIAPVLDLTGVHEEAKKLDNLTNVVPITAAASFDQASLAATEQAASQKVADEAAAAAAIPKEVKFEQNNYSPEALSTADVYRNTNNQLSQAKKALDDAA